MINDLGGLEVGSNTATTVSKKSGAVHNLVYSPPKTEAIGTE